MLIFTPTCHKANYEIYVPVIKKGMDSQCLIYSSNVSVWNCRQTRWLLIAYQLLSSWHIASDVELHCSVCVRMMNCIAVSVLEWKSGDGGRIHQTTRTLGQCGLGVQFTARRLFCSMTAHTSSHTLAYILHFHSKLQATSKSATNPLFWSFAW